MKRVGGTSTHSYTSWCDLRLLVKAKHLQGLALFPWAVLEGQGHFRMFLEDQAKEAGVRLNAVMECSSYTQIAMAVQTGRYAGFLPEFAKTAFAGNNAVLQRSLGKGLRYSRSLVLAWKEATARNRPIVTTIVQELKKRIR